jgi:hypothetical protein
MFRRLFLGQVTKKLYCVANFNLELHFPSVRFLQVIDNFSIHGKVQSRTKYIDITPKQVLVNSSAVNWSYKLKDNEQKKLKKIIA